MEDLCMLMEDDYTKLNREGDHEVLVEDTEDLSEAIAFGMGMGFAAEMVGHEHIDNLSNDPADILEDFQEANKEIKLDIRNRHPKSAMNVPAFEAYVYKRCGIII